MRRFESYFSYYSHTIVWLFNLDLEVIDIARVRRCKYAGCRTFVDISDGYYCKEHADQAPKREVYSRTKYNKYTRNRSEDKREQYNFYRSKIWSSLRRVVLERDHYLCQYCLALGTVTPNSKIGDHVTPFEVAPELRTDPKNIATACRACDNAKRTLEQQIYGTGQGNTLHNQQLRLTVKEWALKIKHAREGL